MQQRNVGQSARTQRARGDWRLRVEAACASVPHGAFSLVGADLQVHDLTCCFPAAADRRPRSCEAVQGSPGSRPQGPARGALSGTSI